MSAALAQAIELHAKLNIQRLRVRKDTAAAFDAMCATRPLKPPPFPDTGAKPDTQAKSEARQLELADEYRCRAFEAMRRVEE